MKTILLLGGMTPDVTALYYNTINQVVRSRLGGTSAAPLYLYSANLEYMIQHAVKGDWSAFAGVYTDAIKAIGTKVDGIAICAILAHKVSRQLSEVSSAAGIPLLHIADFLAGHITSNYPQVRCLGLLGPKITMLDSEDPDFFVGRLQQPQYGFRIIVPATKDAIEEVNRGMLQEVSKGVAAVTEATKAMFIEEAKHLISRGAEAIILGSTDLGFILKQNDLGEIPLIEPANIHAEELGTWICKDSKK